MTRTKKNVTEAETRNTNKRYKDEAQASCGANLQPTGKIFEALLTTPNGFFPPWFCVCPLSHKIVIKWGLSTTICKKKRFLPPTMELQYLSSSLELFLFLFSSKHAKPHSARTTQCAWSVFLQFQHTVTSTRLQSVLTYAHFQNAF